MIVYHWEPNGADGRVLLCLHEKGLDFGSRYVDVLGLEHYRAPFLQVSERAELPLLVDGGTAYSQASYICEYLEEAYGDVQLMPAEPLARWRVREWQKFVDDRVAPALGKLTWQAYRAIAVVKVGEQVYAKLPDIPIKEQRDTWQAALAGYSEAQMDIARDRARRAIQKMEADLASSCWLGGDSYSLADVAMFPFANYLPRVMPDDFNKQSAPLSAHWLQRMLERPAVKATLAAAQVPDPYVVAAPATEGIRWG